MIESQSILKRQKSDYDSGWDRLSDLPLSIIHTILSSLPIKDAVRTSILSREWRYTWTGIPKLEFISNVDGNKYKKTTSEKRLKEFISYALSVHKGSLHKFKLVGSPNGPCPNPDEWLIRLSTKDIKELLLMTNFSSLPSIYSCNKLTCLDLVCCDVGPPPTTFNGFSFLRNLTLRMVKISSATVESLVSNSPLLESLVWDQYYPTAGKNSILRVHAPNLKCLQLLGYWTEMSMNAPLLAKIRIVLCTNELHGSSFCNYTNFLGGCTNLEELNGNGQFTQVMSNDMESWNPNLLVFHRLTTILLDDVDFRDVKQQSVVARLLVGAPNLQYLSIMASFSSETQDVHFSGFRFEPNFRMEKLRVVKMDNVRGLLHEIKLIEYLLERSPLLETMRVRYTRRLGTEEIKDLTDKILGCTPASLTVNISVSASKLCLIQLLAEFYGNEENQPCVSLICATEETVPKEFLETIFSMKYFLGTVQSYVKEVNNAPAERIGTGITINLNHMI